MCGITGYYSREEGEESVLKKMTQTLIHRGPDAEGFFVSSDRKLGLGFRRLAVIDLSSSGNQPMKSACSDTWIVFNGEIYNFKELRRELEEKGHPFRSHSDTEVLLHLWEEEGEKLVQKLNGMFAFAIWDGAKKTLFLARDHLGIKPLYWTLTKGNFIFGSEIKAILEHPLVGREMNEEALNYYLTFGCTPAPHTLFKGIHKLEAGHFLFIDKTLKVRKEEYWDPIKSAVENPVSWKSEVFFVEETRNLLGDSIKKQMASDVPFGCYLSGGIDSSTNAILMSQAMGKPVETFSIGFKDFEKYNELQYSRQVAELLGSKRHEVLIDSSDFFNWLPKYAFHADDPNGDPVCLPVYYVSKLVRDSGVIMAQVGEGSDELFAGYGTYLMYYKIWKNFWYWTSILPRPIKKLVYFLAFKLLGEKRDLYREHLRRWASGEELFWGGAVAFSEIQKGKLLAAEFKAKKFPGSYELIKKYYNRIDSAGRFDFLERLTYLELKIRLPELLLMRVDKMAMASSVEARVPFLDRRLVEMAIRIPMALKLKNGESKHILKEAIRGIVPDNIIGRKKQGFGTPFGDWLKKDEFSEKIKGLVFSSMIMRKNYFNGDYINKLFSEHKGSSTDNSARIWNLLSLALWSDKWL